MRVDLPSRLIFLAVTVALAVPSHAQQTPNQQTPNQQTAEKQTSGSFRWIDFHDPKDQNIVVWVQRSLQVEKWTAIREIGVMYDAALVVTTDREGPQSSPGDDTFTIWNASLTSHIVAPLLKGVNPRWFDWETFAPDAPQELTLLYDNCHDCAASTFFTSFRYDLAHHMFVARWIRGGQGVLVWNSVPPSAPDVQWTQVFALMSGAENRAYLATWNHFDYGKKRQPADTIFRYDVDAMTGQERTIELTRDDAVAMKLHLCRGQDAVQGMERGQDSDLCQQLLDLRPGRQPVTTPPANNRGQSVGGRITH